MKILEIIQRTTDFFQRQGVDSPRLTIELMVAHVLKRKRLELYLDFEREITEPALDTLREMVKRRAAGEPLQYVLGVVNFYGFDFAVDKRVLVPRPETELLVDYVVKNSAAAKSIADLGTGSGAIAIALAKSLASARVLAVDASVEALEVARANAAALDGRVEFFQGDLLAPLPAGLQCDWVVSNPPYIPSGEIALLPREIRDHEPRAALDGGADGLDIVRRIAAEAKPWLSAGGRVAVEIGAGQGSAAERIFLDNGYRVEKMLSDWQGHPRVLVAAG
ncbi:MAG: peptide chain release factor N(5)-glutamine methyltransferase [Verrucomicrobia bacterium]|nr:peptide chain release factor N(5)-glutamine methyltransferase [Verrucomicrobiota bacterium]